MPTLRLENEAATARLARLMAPHLRPGDTIGVTGGLGAGKSHFCRLLIATRLAEFGISTDIPSPSFTLVQTYEAGETAIWHADLYRLGDLSEIAELGLEEAFDDALCLVEWADRLQEALPSRIMLLHLEFDRNAAEVRVAEIEVRGPGWDWLTDVVHCFGKSHA